MSKRNWFRTIWFFFVILFFIWQWSTYQSKGVEEALKGKPSEILIKEDNSMISISNERITRAEILFYPGGLVDPKSYLPLGCSIAESGYSVHIIKMPWRMATKGYNRIKELFDLENKNKLFIIGGHSQGGKMAAQFVFENENLLSGLFLLGTSHPRDISLYTQSIPTLKIYGELDGLASVEEVTDNQDKLPKGAKIKIVNGGNHSYFGYFGNLLMDGNPEITRTEQHEITLSYLNEFLEEIVLKERMKTNDTSNKINENSPAPNDVQTVDMR